MEPSGGCNIVITHFLPVRTLSSVNIRYNTQEINLREKSETWTHCDVYIKGKIPSANLSIQELIYD